ncbi:MAG TPA: hypothetical protein VFE05_00140 [Longimicrobiaceae bacterium]|nr:hypothetical protein [Longimicrobiaceae bacterium]
MQKTTRIALAAAAALALPATARAQQTPPAPPAAPAPAGAQAEIASIQQRLAQLQQQAAQDPSVQAPSAVFDSVTLAAMDRLDPAAPGKRARAAAIKGDVDAATAAHDNAKLNALAAEAPQLQSYFNQLRQRALALPEVQAARKTYIDALFARMSAIDPQAQTMVARLQELRSGGATAAPAAPPAAPAPQS